MIDRARARARARNRPRNRCWGGVGNDQKAGIVIARLFDYDYDYEHEHEHEKQPWWLHRFCDLAPPGYEHEHEGPGEKTSMVSIIPRLVLATNNSHKVEEIRDILKSQISDFRFEILCGADFPDFEPPEETGTTFEENALLKARAYARATGLPALADDSGLVVDALGGRPGVESARYEATAELRNSRVLRELEGVEPARRTARFECVVAFAEPGGRALARRGTVEGRIAFAPRGSAGFGYDPIFELLDPPHAGLTAAELSPAEKNAISHRGRVLAALAPLLAEALAPGK